MRNEELGKPPLCLTGTSKNFNTNKEEREEGAAQPAIKTTTKVLGLYKSF